MAQDNAAQAIRDLKKNLEDADMRVKALSTDIPAYFQKLTAAFSAAAKSANVSIDQIFDYIAKKRGAVAAQKIKLQFDTAKAKSDIDDIIQALGSKQRSVTLFGGDTLTGSNAMKERLLALKKEYELLAAQSKKTVAQMTDDLLNIVNATVGRKNQSSGTALGKARAKEMEGTQKAMTEINRLIEERNKLEANLKKQGHADKYYDRQRKGIEEVNRKIEEQKRLLSSYGGRGRQALSALGGDGSATALRQQEQNFRKLNMLLNERRKLEAQIKAQGGTANETQSRYQRILNAEIKNTVNSMRELGKRYEGITRQAARNTMEERARRTKKTIDSLNGSLKQTRSNLSSMIHLLQRLGSAFGIVFSVRGLAQFGKKLVETRGEFEMQFVAMKQIIGDVDAATKIWGQTMQQALKSPFKAMQLVTYTKQLAAYRIETEKLFDTTKRLADVSAGLGVDMGRLILAYGQVKSANFLRASEVRQFTEAGVNIAGNLAKYFSELEGRAVSTAEVMERITKRMVSFADVEEIFKRMTDEGGEFYKMQEIQTNTVKGQLMKLQDAYQQMLNTLGESKEGTIKNLINSLNSLIKNWKLVAIFIQKNVVWLGLLLPLILSYRRGTKLAADETLTWARTMELSSFGFKKFAASIKSGELAMKGFLGMANLAKTALKTFVPLLVIEGLIALTSALTDASRANSRLQADLSKIRGESGKRADDEISNYDKLIKKMNELNKGSAARKDIIDKINSQYGEYIGFIVDETNSLDDLQKVQARVNANIRENARARAEEAAEQKIQERFIEREQKILGGNWLTRTLGDNASLLGYTDISGTSDISVSVDDAAKFAEFYRKKMHALTDEQVEELSNDKDRLLEVTKEWFESFMGFEVKDISKNTGFKWLADLFLEEEKSIRDSSEKITSELQGLTKEQQEEIKKMDASVEEAIQNLYHAKKGDEIEVYPNVKIGVPTDLSGNEGIFEVLKQEINKHKDDFIIEIKLQAGLITEEQAAKARDAGKTTGSIFVDEVNKQITEGILKDAGFDASYEELLEQILYYPELISNWDEVNHIIELVNNNLINASDITNGTTAYTKELANNLEVARQAIDDAVKAQKLVADGTEKEKDDAQKLVDKTRERYRILLRIAKLMGLGTKAEDEIVEEQGYDLSVGQARLEAAQKAFEKKFGKSSNTYGKQLSQIGVTENEKELADAYHKQAEELDGLIKSEETAYNAQKKLGELDEEQLAAIQEKIKNLGVEKEMAEFLALLFGYVPKKTSSRSSHENASKLISLIKEMRGEYDKLSKSAYGYAKSEEKVRESYAQSVEKILGKAGVTKDYDFTTNEGMIAALDKVLAYANKLGPEAAAEVQKYIDQLETEIEINAQVRIREDFGKQMEKAFNDYELTIELKKLNISPEAAKGLFPEFDAQTLGDLQNEMQAFYMQQGATFDEEDLKEYQKWAEKLDSEILKDRKEKAKDYSKYLEKEYSERAKLEMKYAQDVAFVTANFNGEQRQNILSGIEDKYKKDISELTWKSFKESAFYVEMMDDLSSIPVDYMQIMLGKIEELLQNPETLSPRALKEAINARQKILESLMDYDQVKVMSQSLSEIHTAMNDSEVGGSTWRQTKKRLDEQQKLKAEELANLEKEIRANETLQGQLKGLEDAQQAFNDASANLSKQTQEDLKGKDSASLMAEYNVELKNARKSVKAFSEIEGEATSEQRDANAKLVARIEYLEIAIPLLEAYKKASEGLWSYENTDEGKAATSAQDKGQTSSSIGTIITGQKSKADNLSNRLSLLKKWQKSFVNLNNAWAKFNKNAADMASRLGALASASFELYEALGGETNAMTEAWKEFGSTITNVITESLTMIPQLVAGFTAAGVTINAAMGIIGLIAEAIQLVLVLITGLSKLHDAGYEKEIEKQQKNIDNLNRAYERLERQIEKTWDTISYMKIYSDETQNLYEQIQAINAQMNAEESKKKVDKDKIQDYKDKIQDAEDELEDLNQKQIEVFGGIGEEGYRDAAQEFVDAWKSAFLETGDGLQGLQDHFDEFLNEWFVKQATMRVAGKKLEPLFRDIDNAVDKYSGGGTSVMMSELAKIRERFGIIAPQLSDTLEELSGLWGIGGEGGLSGLAAGIQGMTEEQANVLEAYWNSVRGYTANIDMNVSRIAQILGAGGDNANPMLHEMELIAQNTSNIRELLNTVSYSGGEGVGIRVYSY